MTHDEAIEKLQECQARAPYDEESHVIADDILCDLLRSLGHTDVADEWDKVSPKWYS